ncbi:MAG: hypothetical protein AMXMBFR84_04440 [Candidatus Hydrogenedentota bacterium]
MLANPSAIDQTAPQTANRDNTLRFVVNAGTRHWKMITILTVVGALAIGGYGLMTRTTHMAFAASADLIVHRSPWEQGILQDLGKRPMFESSPKALIDRVSKRAVAENVARALVAQDIDSGGQFSGIATETEYASKARQIDAMLSLEPDQESGLIHVQTEALNEQDAARIVEYAARAFIQQNLNFVREQEEETHAFVQRQLEDVRQQLDAAQKSEWEFRKEMGFRTKELVTEDLKALTLDLTTAETKKEEIRAIMASIESQLKEKEEQLPVSLSTINDQVVNELIVQLNELHKERITMSVAFTPNYPPLQELQEEIREKEDAIMHAVRELNASVGTGQDVWEDRKNLRDQYVNLQVQLTSVEIQTSTNRKLIEELETVLPGLAEKDKDYQNLVRAVRQHNDQYLQLLDKEFELSSAIQRGSGTIERSPTPPFVQPKPHEGQRGPIFLFLSGGLVGLTIGIGLALLLEGMNTSIRSIEDVSIHLGQEVIGTIPRMRFGPPTTRRRGTYVPVKDEDEVDACIVTQHDPKSPISEAYRTLRTNFQFSTLQYKPRTILITSAVPGEGKTTTAVNMAVTFADSGFRVLLLDTDLRRPHVHHVLKMERGPGLADVLRDGLDYKSVLRTTRVENLWSISAGRVPPNPSELVGSERMRNLLNQMRNDFDLIICDAPSLLVVTDPVLLARELDSVVLVVSVDNARRETVQRGIKLLETAQARIAGVVLNGLEASRRHYYYYYYYYEDAPVRRRKAL